MTTNFLTAPPIDGGRWSRYSNTRQIRYLELRRTTGLTESILDEALAGLEQMGMIHSKKSANEVLYWKAVAQPAKEWYSVDDAAKYLPVSKRTIRQSIRDGEMVAYRVGPGGHRGIRRTDLDGPMHREDNAGLVELGEAVDPVLSELWYNEQDADYDRL